MTTKTISGTYTGGYVVASGVSVLDVTATGYVGGGGVAASWPVTIYSLGRIKNTNGPGIYLYAGGSVTNGAKGSVVAVIEGATNGIFTNYASTVEAAVTNFGTIEGLGGDGVDLLAGGSIIDGVSDSAGALIKGSRDGVFVAYGATITNFGTIEGASGDGVYLRAGGSIANQAGGLIEGNIGVSIATGSSMITNFGTIDGTGGVAVQFAGIDNYLVEGTTAVLDGSIAGFTAYDTIDLRGVAFNSADTVTYSSGHLFVKRGDSTLASLGVSDLTIRAGDALKLSGDGEDGTDIRIAPSAQGTYTGHYAYVRLIYAYRNVTFTSSAVIDALTGDAVSGGTLGVYSLLNDGNIEAIGTNGVGLYLPFSGTLVNFGKIEAPNGVGVWIYGGGVITNGGAADISALIAGGEYGVMNGSTTGTLSNFGTIEATATNGVGAGFYGGGFITNGSTTDISATLAGKQFGVRFGTGGLTGTIKNFGTIESIEGDGVYLGPNDTLTNETGGLIKALVGVDIAPNAGELKFNPFFGVYSVGSVTISNYGTIDGAGGVAVQFAGTGNLLIEGGAAVLDGSIAGFTAYDSIDLRGVTFNSADTVTYSSGHLIVRHGGTTSANLDVRGLTNPAGDALKLIEDTSGGTEIEFIHTAHGTYSGHYNYVSLKLFSSVTFTTTALVDAAIGTAVLCGEIFPLNPVYSTTLINQGIIESSAASGVGVAFMTGLDYYDGLYFGRDRVTNLGTIEAAAAGGLGVKWYRDGNLTNGSAVDTTALIKGGQDGVGEESHSLANFGTIEGAAGYGVAFANVLVNGANGSTKALVLGGSIGVYGVIVTNFGTIEGGSIGVRGETVANFGLIESTKGDGVYLQTGNTITNQASAVIKGVVGVMTAVNHHVGGSPPVDTITNYGTIDGIGGVAIQFNGTGNLLVEGAKAVLHGSIGGFVQGDTIDLPGVIFDSADRVTYSSGLLVIEQAGTTYADLSVSGVTISASDTVKLFGDGSGGTDIKIAPSADGTYSGHFTYVGLNYNYTTATFTAGTIVDATTKYVAVGSGRLNAYTVFNRGTIEASANNSLGMYIGDGGAVTNGGVTDTTALIEGGTGGVRLNSYAVSVANYGTIAVTAGQYGTAVYCQRDGTVINGSVTDTAALIRGGSSGVTFEYAGALTNYGTIEGVDWGVVAAMVTNGAAGSTKALIQGGVLESGGVVSNFGTIISSYNYGVEVDGGSLTNGAKGNNAAVIDGGHYGVVVTDNGGTIINFGTIIGRGDEGRRDSVLLSSSGVLVLEAGSELIGEAVGGHGTLELGAGGVGTLTGLGSGTLSGSTSGLVRDFGSYVLASGADWTLAGASTISGGRTLWVFGTLTNAGSISGGVRLGSGGSILNLVGRSLINSVTAVYGVAGAPAAVTNAGTIDGTGASAVGIYLRGGGNVTNAAGGLVEGGAFGVELAAAGTVTNFDTIEGGTDSVLFKSASDKLVIEDKSKLVGRAVGGGGTLELDARLGTITGLGATGILSVTEAGTFSDFSHYIISEHSNWTLIGNNAIAAGQTLTDDGLLTVKGSLDFAGDVGIGVASGDSGVLVNSGLVEKTDGTENTAIATRVVNSGKIEVVSGTVALQAAVSGSGTDIIGAFGTFLFGASVAGTQTVEFAGSTGELILDDPLRSRLGFAGVISGFTGSDEIDLPTFSYGATTKLIWSQTADMLTITDKAKSVALHIKGTYSGFTEKEDTGGGTIIEASQAVDGNASDLRASAKIFAEAIENERGKSCYVAVNSSRRLLVEPSLLSGYRAVAHGVPPAIQTWTNLLIQAVAAHGPEYNIYATRALDAPQSLAGILLHPEASALFDTAFAGHGGHT